MGLIPTLTDGGRGLLISALSGTPLNFTKLKIGNGQAPEEPNNGDYWYDTANSDLYRYSKRWDDSVRTITISTTEPENPSSDDLWYSTETSVLKYYGKGWVASSETITCASTAPVSPSEGDYWFNTANLSALKVYGYEWLEDTDTPLTAAADAPSQPSAGDYWYDTTNSQLKKYALAWINKDDVTLTVSDTAPASPENGDYWYDTENSVLKIYDSTETSWLTSQQSFSYGASEPTAAPASPSAGNWWYDTTNSQLKSYSLTWVSDSHPFSYGNTAPVSPSAGNWWYDTALHVYGLGWITSNKTFFYGSAAPSRPSQGYWWFDSGNSILYEYGMLFQRDTGDNFTYADTEPVRAYEDDLWYDTENNQLKVYATGWVSDTSKTITYAQSAPVSPSAGSWWYDTENDILYEYSGTQWVTSDATISCSISPPATPDSLEDLVNPLISIPITNIEYGSNYVALTGVFDNSTVSSTFNWSETGVFAENESSDGDVLYAYCHSGDQYETIPANNVGKTINTTLTILVMVGDAETVTATIGEGAIYATKEQFEEHRRDFTNPHGVNAEQIGLGNVVNVAPKDMAITYTTASTLSELTSGEKMETLLGKVKKAINTLILHLSASNPHGITPSKIGAAASSHNHSTSNITSGILSVSRGGTGSGSYAELASKLTTYFSTPIFGTYTGNGTVKRSISLSFTPKALIVVDSRGRMTHNGIVYGGVCIGTKGVRTPACTAASHNTTWSNGHTALLVGTNLFWVSESGDCKTNTSNEVYYYIAFK